MVQGLLVVLVAALAVLGANAADQSIARSLAQFDYEQPTFYPSFPFCKCDRDTIYNPNRMSYDKQGPLANGVNYLQFHFFLDSVPVPPAPTACSMADIGKVELIVRTDASSCIKYAESGPERTNHTVDFTLLTNDINIMKVTNMFYSQAMVQAGGNFLPINFQLLPGCTYDSVFNAGPIQYSIFNSMKNCCPTGILGGFPYCNCNPSTIDSPWRTKTKSIVSVNGGQQVTLNIYIDPAAQNTCALPMNKLEINLFSVSVSMMYRGSFKDAMIGVKKTSAIYWETTRPVVKFTNLGVSCAEGLGAGVDLNFFVQNATLAAICQGSVCQYADFDTTGLTGHCPGGYFATSM